MSRTTNEPDRLATRDIRNVLVVARQAQERSLADVADHIGVHLQQLSRWEQANAAMPNIDSLCRWADALGYEIALLPKGADSA